jgi:hypothetical protein
MILGIAGIPARENGAQEGLAEEGPTPASLPSVVCRLPSELQASVAQIAAAGRGPYGHTPTQEIFDRHLTTFEEIYRIGAQHADVCELLYETGIRREDGARLDIGTVSSALSRARTKAVAERRGSKTGKKTSKRSRLARVEPTGDGNMTQNPRSLPEEPEYEIVLPPPPAPETSHTAIQAGSPHILSKAPATGVDYGDPREFESAASLRPTARPPSPAARGSPTNGNLANVRNAGALLNKIRNNHD